MNIDPILLARLILRKDQPVLDGHGHAMVLHQAPRKCIAISREDAEVINQAGIGEDILILELQKTYAILWDPQAYKDEYEYSIAKEERSARRKKIAAELSITAQFNVYIERLFEDPLFLAKGKAYWKQKCEALFLQGGLPRVVSFMQAMGEACYDDKYHFVEKEETKETKETNE